MITLANGICIIIPENGRLDIFSNKPFTNDIKTMNDPMVTTDMRLCKDGNKAMFIQNKDVYSISMK